ncbi:diguanylate cyclase [Fervidobacterium islandicum]|uniref:Diguanylate cyclase n=1 Tax=Fervidobacterium islandicum TaxID=2423 RepID=A0AAI8CKF9_FERIS|nr:diguanylate cyclase [Fervidobacterium islandicum]AMW32571.1 diguanylate cyclase [Fervidobacterium islandicum]
MTISDKKVMIVDDSKFWRMVLQSVFAKLGVKQIVVAEDGMKGIETALRELPDIIITDYNMPGISGLQMCLYLRSIPAFKNAGIVVLTGSDDVINEFWAEHSGANKFISKLLPKEALESELERFVSNDYSTSKTKEAFYVTNIYDVLEQKMRTEILNREILSLIEYARDELYVIQKFKNFLEFFSRFTGLAFMLLSPVEGRIYNFGLPLGKTVSKERLLRHLEKPIEPSDWSYFGNFGSEFNVDGLETVVVKYQENEIGLIAYEGASDKWSVSKVLNEASESIALLFNTLNSFRELKVASAVDGLTGLFNKKELLRFLEETHNLAKFNRTIYYVAMFDVDNFKKVNDTYGHLVGDEVLKAVAAILKEEIAGKGIAGRYGGEEFCLVITKAANNDEVVEMIERILERVRNTQFPHGKCTVSCGVVSSEGYESPTEVIKAADDLLYISKKTGKDKASYMFLPKNREINQVLRREQT